VLFSFQISLALGLDLLFGDPQWLYHPVRAIGLLCTTFENLTRTWTSSLGMRMCGVITFVLVLGCTLTVLFTGLYLLAQVGGSLVIPVSVALLYLAIAAGDLAKHSEKVFSSLSSAHLDQARVDIGMLVGRETNDMNRVDISRACVESVAENFVDGVTAPLFWAFLFSLLFNGTLFDPITIAVFGAYFYKTINTMDSMFGYKNERYIEFGWIAARSDDVVNYIPARLSAAAIVIAATILGMDYKNSFRVLVRDRLKSSSPNSGYPEAAVSGALSIQLGGPAVYFGKPTKGHIIGEGQRAATIADIKRVNQLCLTSTLLFFAALIVLYNILIMA